MELEDILSLEIAKAGYAIEMTTFNKYNDYKPISWWEKKIDLLKNLSFTSNLEKKQLGEKLKAQLILHLWEGNRHLALHGYYRQALEMAEILIYVQYNSPKYFAIKAESLLGLEKKTEACKYYTLALEYGFSLEDSVLLKHSSLLNNLNSEVISINSENYI